MLFLLLYVLEEVLLYNGKKTQSKKLIVYTYIALSNLCI